MIEMPTVESLLLTLTLADEPNGFARIQRFGTIVSTAPLASLRCYHFNPRTAAVSALACVCLPIASVRAALYRRGVSSVEYRPCRMLTDSVYPYNLYAERT
jgi:O-antigen ligase